LKSFHLQGFSKPLVNILLAGNRPATHAAYGSAWRNWVDWCLRRSENPLSPPLSSVLEFLASLHTEGKAYSTINVHRSMLSSTLPHIDNHPIGQHPLVKSLMNGCYNINPPKPKYNSIWDPELVVHFVSVLGKNYRLSIKDLSPDSTLQSHRRPKHVTLRRLGCTWHIADSQVYIPRTSFTYGQCPLRRDLIAVLIPSHWMDFRRTWDGKRISRSH
jgi:hypothetical protein